MGSDNIFKRSRINRKKNEINKKNTKESPWILICEGQKTEPNYFVGLEKYLNSLGSKKIKIKPVGVGRSTNSLVNNAEIILKKADIIYSKMDLVPDKIICIFDKDDATDEEFDSSIRNAKSRGYQVAWSNECFEVWLYAHFYYCESAMSRETIFEKLTELFKKEGILQDNQNYEEDGKVLPEIFGAILHSKGDVNRAIRNSKKVYNTYDKCKPSKMTQCSTVYLLVEQMLDEVNST